MLAYAAEALPTMLDPADIERGEIYPKISDIREISITVAAAVMKAAVEDDVASVPLVPRLKKKDDEAFKAMTESSEKAGHEIRPYDKQLEMKTFIRSKVFDPAYVPLVYMKNKLNQFQISQRAFRYERVMEGSST